MMRRILPAVLVVLGSWQSAHAQFMQQIRQPVAPGGAYGPYGQPPVSPYINLLRGGSSAGVNYYGIVRPQMYFRNTVQRLQQDVNSDQQAIAGMDAGMADMMPATGVRSGFMLQNRYFMNAAFGGTGSNMFYRSPGGFQQRQMMRQQLSQTVRPAPGAGGQGNPLR